MNNKKTTKTDKPGEPIRWKGKHIFLITGTNHDDDTIRIPAGHRKDEILYKLILPTLCLTYADMKFANDIGGEQLSYPDSKVYGSKYFDPPVIINGGKEIEKFTWIRGAEKLSIGPKETIVEWWGWRDLVIPKLRINPKEKVRAVILVSEVRIAVNEPFKASVMQYADGRHVGGVQIVKRHPDWKPSQDPFKYDLFIRVIDGKTRRAIPEAKVKIFSWEKEKREFVHEASYYTNGMGIVDVMDLPGSDGKLITVSQSSYLTQTWRFRPISGQGIKKFFRLWKSEKIDVDIDWRVQNTLKDVAKMTASRRVEILRLNKLRSERELKPGKTIRIPGFEAKINVDQGDTIDRIADYFCYNSSEELAEANNLSDPVKLYPDQEIKLPGWRFIFAKHNDLFATYDEQFCIPAGWSRPAQRTLHDDPTKSYENEVIAVPTREFMRGHKMRRIY